MLRLLNISNLAVIDSLKVDFGGGLNVLSGETGSGKSIMIDALGLLLGERASVEMIRTGSERAFVEGVFEIEGNEPLLELLGEAGIELEGEDLIIRRELSSGSAGSGGRSRIFINNRTASINLLKTIQPHVIDLHGQGDQQSLLYPETHLNLLDAYAGAAAKRRATTQAYEHLLKTAKELESARQSESERLQALDLVEFQLSEIEQANLRIDEDAELETERNLLANAEKLAALCAEVYGHIYEDETAVLTRLAVVSRKLGDLAEVDQGFATHREQLETAKHLLDDLAYFLRDYVDGIQASPERLKLVEDRLVEIDRLKRKYGKSLGEVIGMRDQLTERREALQRSEERAQQLENDLRRAFESYRQAADELGETRRAAAKKFERALGKELSDVALGAARFSIRFAEAANPSLAERLETLAGIRGLIGRRSGREEVEFFFSANPGEDLRPMNAVASGGELSRLMLILKTITAPTLFPRTLIFDEIDAGIGGKVADAVGSRLKRLAATNQVLCVTHQSQIARYADSHFQISKEIAGGRTITKAAKLDQEGRIEELARMIGGAEITPLARKHAKELLQTLS